MTGSRVVITRSEAETAAEAARLARSLAPSAIVLMFGDLGAGKTAFVRGMAAGLGLDPAEVSSPTFTIIQEYRPAVGVASGHGGAATASDQAAAGPASVPAVARPTTLFHVDLYRLEGAEIDDLGLEELTADGGVAAIEWAEKLSRPVAGAVRVYISEEGEEGRRIEIVEGVNAE